MKGLFITIEGTDGAGKSTQIKLLKDYIESKGRKVIVKREPGGTDISEKIRSLILDIENREMTSITEAMLYAAARAQLVGEVIKPALEAGYVVICDRFIDSSIVYQGFARKMGVEIIETINKYAIDGINPDVTLFFDLEPEKGILRKKAQTELDRMESEKMEFHKMVYDGYKRLLETYPERIIPINAEETIENVHKQVVEVIKKYLV